MFYWDPDCLTSVFLAVRCLKVVIFVWGIEWAMRRKRGIVCSSPFGLCFLQGCLLVNRARLAMDRTALDKMNKKRDNAWSDLISLNVWAAAPFLKFDSSNRASNFIFYLYLQIFYVWILFSKFIFHELSCCILFCTMDGFQGIGSGAIQLRLWLMTVQPSAANFSPEVSDFKILAQKINSLLLPRLRYLGQLLSSFSKI